jgi:DNA transformation protein
LDVSDPQPTSRPEPERLEQTSDSDPPRSPTRLRDLRNLGPASERMLVAAGIATPEELDRLGSLEAYRRAMAAGGHRSLNFLWSLEAALLDLDWRDLPEDRKASLRRQVESEQVRFEAFDV